MSRSSVNFNIEIQPLHNPGLAQEVMNHWNDLTKPPGSLGRLESLVERLALIQGTANPSLARKAMYIFCADHGVTAEGISAYPAEVTPQMVKNFLRGGAAINVLCRQFGIEPVVVDAGVKGPSEPGVVNRKVREGTCNFAREHAMSRQEAEHAMECGVALADEAASQFDVAGVGEMGIGNTTAASALLCAFTGIPAHHAVGRGTGLDDEGLERKVGVVARALALHRPDAADPVGVLSALGGFEIAMMAGFLLGAAQRRLPVVVDGFISGSAALAAQAVAPAIGQYLFFSHQSAEPGHPGMLAGLGAEPLLSLGLRLGEGTGAALAIGVLEAALRLYAEMAAFSGLGVKAK
ncbi:MAG: nicotinate-nucleotide--dimethylbenzimidazole phosphoribosyltransferase [Bryobacteraceae bacterium]